MKTKVTKLLGIKHPVFQGGMAWVSNAGLAAAVSNAGGLGIIAAGNAPAEIVEKEILRIRELTDKPFGLNVMLMSPSADAVAELAAKMKVPVVVTGAGSAGKYIPMWKEAGIKVIPVVSGVALAKRMEKSGCAAVIAEGSESGGHIGEHNTMSLVPQVVRAVSVPVIAAGGIADGAGLAAALCLGAEGVQCGTVFLACAECNIHQKYKDAVLAAGDNSTAVTGRSTGLRVRGLKNELTNKVLELEKQNKSAEEIELFTVGALKRAVQDGDTDMGSLMAGQIAGLVTEIRPAKDIIEDMVTNAMRILKEKTNEIGN